MEYINFSSEDNNSPSIFIYKFIDLFRDKTLLKDYKIISMINPLYYYDKMTSSYIFGFIGTNSANEYTLIIFEIIGISHYNMIKKNS